MTDPLNRFRGRRCSSYVAIDRIVGCCRGRSARRGNVRLSDVLKILLARSRHSVKLPSFYVRLKKPPSTSAESRAAKYHCAQNPTTSTSITQPNPTPTIQNGNTLGTSFYYLIYYLRYRARSDTLLLTSSRPRALALAAPTFVFPSRIPAKLHKQSTDGRCLERSHTWKMSRSTRRLCQ